MKKKSAKKKKKEIALKQLVIANAIATLVLIAVAVTVLWALGLLGSIFTFFF